MINREDEEAAWTLFMMSHSVPMGTKTSVVEALEREERVFRRFPRKKRTLRVHINGFGMREPTSEWLVQLMKVKNGKNPKKIIIKGLTATDVKSNNNRLSIPVSQIVDREFLNPSEETIIAEDSRKIRKKGVSAILVASDLKEFKLNLRLWDMGNSPIYNLVTGWNQVVQDYRLKEDDNINLWSFHANGELYFALVPPSAQ